MLETLREYLGHYALDPKAVAAAVGVANSYHIPFAIGVIPSLTAQWRADDERNASQQKVERLSWAQAAILAATIAALVAIILRLRSKAYLKYEE